MMTYVKGIENDVTHRKIFTISKILTIFMFLKTEWSHCFYNKKLCFY